MGNFAAVFILILGLVACKSSDIVREIDADIWLNERPSAELCKPDSDLWNYGIYRKVSCSKNPKSQFCQHGEKQYEEFIPYCDPVIEKYLSMHKDDKKKWTDALVK